MNFSKLLHNRALFEALAARARGLHAGVRSGAMFGCPALYCGKKLAGCVYGDRIALKLPRHIADEARESGRAGHFTPYGRPPMREWIEIAVEPANIVALDDLIATALDFAERNNI